jgi:hypothetical protein
MYEIKDLKGCLYKKNTNFVMQLSQINVSLLNNFSAAPTNDKIFMYNVVLNSISLNKNVNMIYIGVAINLYILLEFSLPPLRVFNSDKKLISEAQQKKQEFFKLQTKLFNLLMFLNISPSNLYSKISVIQDTKDTGERQILEYLNNSVYGEVQDDKFLVSKIFSRIRAKYKDYVEQVTKEQMKNSIN